MFYETKGVLYNESLGSQICEVLESSDFTALSRIVLEDVSRSNAYYSNPIVLPYQQVKQACRKGKVAYKKVESKHRRMSRRKGKPVILLKGGSESASLHKVVKMRFLRRKKWGHEEERKQAKALKEERVGRIKSEFPGIENDDMEFVNHMFGPRRRSSGATDSDQFTDNELFWEELHWESPEESNSDEPNAEEPEPGELVPEGLTLENIDSDFYFGTSSDLSEPDLEEEVENT